MTNLDALQATRGCYCLKARKASRAITRLYEAKLRPHGLRATQFSVLAVLTLKGPTRLGELASILDLERTTLTRIAGLLETRGWIEDGQADDGRERLLCITDAGRSVLDDALPAWREAQDAVSEPVIVGLPSPSTPLNQSRQFVERALQDFGLIEAFESRPSLERERCLRWIAAAEGEREEERRVSRVLDDLSSGRALPQGREGEPTVD
jgi:DNA-binding MarR family transcriptional regulator